MSEPPRKMTFQCASCWETHDRLITTEEWMVINLDALFCPNCNQMVEVIPVMKVRGDDG